MESSFIEKMSHRNLENEVLEYLRWNPNSRPSDVANALGVSPQLVRAVLARLRRKGLVYRTSRGYVARLLNKRSSGPEDVEDSTVAMIPSERSSMGRGVPSIAPSTSEAIGVSLVSESATEHSMVSPAPPISTQDTSDAKSCCDQLNELRDRIRRVEKAVRELAEYLTIALQSIAIGDREALHRVLDYLQDITEELSEHR